MTKVSSGTKRLRAVRDVLVGQLALLDALGEAHAAIELNAAIEILNGRIGEMPSTDEMAWLQRRYFAG